MKLQTKLFAGFGVILALLCALSLIALDTLHVMNQRMHDLVLDNYRQDNLAKGLSSEVNAINREMNRVFLDTSNNPAARAAAIATARQHKVDFQDKLNELMRMPQVPGSVVELSAITDTFNRFDKLTEEAGEQLILHTTRQVIDQYAAGIDQLGQDLLQQTDKYGAEQEQRMNQSLDNSTLTYRVAFRGALVLLALSLLACMLVALFVTRSITRSLQRMAGVMTAAARCGEESLPRIITTDHDLIGRIGIAYNRLADSIEQHRERERSARTALQERQRQKTTAAELVVGMQGMKATGELARLFLTEAARVLNAGYGALYIRSENDGHLVLQASYAGKGEEIQPETIAFANGEGLVGQCAAAGTPIVIDTPPDRYFRIYSGLGSSLPVQIALLPVQFEEQTIAVLELATLRPFTEDELSFLRELSSVFGIALERLASSLRIQKLLGEAQLFAEEMQAQSEELQLQQEELQALNEKLEEQNRSLERKSQELERTKEQLEQKSDQMAIASAFKTEFLANMSHELRTPLNSLLILSQMLGENREGNLLPRQLQYVRTIHSSGQDLLKLINEILDLAKFESGKMELVLESFPPGDLTEFAERTFAPVALRKGIRFELCLDASARNILICSDSARVRQIVQNLLSNAMKFTEFGRVALRVALGPPDPADEMARNLKIEVEDTGIGIPKEKQSLIFEAFRQADGTTSRKYGGTGLGLSISHQIATLLGGTIEVQSELGVGSVFKVVLPVRIDKEVMGSPSLVPVEGAPTEAESPAEATKRARAEASAASTPSLPDGSVQAIPPAADDAGGADADLLAGKTVLIVDDDMRNIYALTSALEANGMRVRFAENGEEGLEALQRYAEIDLVLMDVMMPKMDGYEAMGRIRRDSRFQSLPIIALTAKAMKHDRRLCLEAGANDYISKPISLEQLFSLIREWLRTSGGR